MQPTGSDIHWRSRLGLRWSATGNEKTPDPRRGRYQCQGCNRKFHLSDILAEHMSTCHGIGIEPNYLNEYSVAELVSGINNVATGKKFRLDDGETKPKFLMTQLEARSPLGYRGWIDKCPMVS
eukprot:3187256-Amphidinium_carterae.1